MSEFAIGAYVRKKSGAFWEGTAVGHYSTDQTPDGVAVQLFGWEDGPVQIYPASALEPCDPTAGRLAPQFLTVNLSEDELAELQVAVRNSAPGKITVATPPPSTHVDLPWDDAKVAFGFNDNSSNDGSIELLEEIWDESLRKPSIWPKGWELNETDTAGARMVVVFRVDGSIKPEDGTAVRKLLDRIEKLDDPRLDTPSPQPREVGSP